MSESGGLLKRKASRDGSVSPPPLRRKIQSGTTQSAVSNFFKPASQKPAEKISWQERSPNDDTPATLLVGKYVPSDVTPIPGSSVTGSKKRKIAAFDFDSTLVSTASGKKHGNVASDWKWWHPSVPETLRKLYTEEGYLLAVVSNQAGTALKANTKASAAQRARLQTFKSKATAVLTQLNLPVSIYAATEKDLYRKPRTGMWTELLEDNNLSAPETVDMENSFFVGDAGGRQAEAGYAKDFSSSDRDFAENVGIKFYTPEEYFLKHKPRAFKRAFDPRQIATEEKVEDDAGTEPFVKKNEQDIVLFVGSPGAGKSTFYFNHLQPLNYVRINQDLLKTREKCFKVAEEELTSGKSVCVDNTNADTDIRARWIALAKKHNIPIRCVHFVAEPEVCKHNDAVRAMNAVMNPEKRTILPGMAFSGFASRYKKPEVEEGFQDLTDVQFKFRGTEEERAIWAQFWT